MISQTSDIGRYLCAVVAASFLLAGCAGSIPSIPNTPEAIVAKADAYYEQDRYFQSAELYKAFLERHPGHDQADYAQFRLGESYFADEQYPLAAVEYRIVIANYGYSEWVDDAVFKTGVCYWEESPKAQRDQRKTQDAINMFKQFIQSYPQSDLIPEAHAYIRKAHAKLAEKVIVTVKWYMNRRRYRAAGIYCDKIIENYPNNPYWVEAMFYRAVIHVRWDENEEARDMLRRVLAYPDDVDIKPQAEAMLEDLEKS